MTQIATVERILDQNHAEISVPRKSACGHDCEECAGCGVTGTAVKARAVNPIGAQPGQKVVVESSTQKMLGIVALVYAIPVALFLVGYVVAGVLLSALGLYQPLVEFAGAGATVPLTGFGHLLATGVQKAVAEKGILGALTGGLTASAAGITAAMIFGLLVALIFNPGDKS